MLLLSLTVFQFLKFAHPGTCITLSEDLHRYIWGPSLHHPRTCIRTSEDLHWRIRTLTKPSRPASGHVDLHHFTKISLASYRNRQEMNQYNRPKGRVPKKIRKFGHMGLPYLPRSLVWTKKSLDKYPYCLPYLPIQKVWTFLNWSLSLNVYFLTFVRILLVNKLGLSCAKLSPNLVVEVEVELDKGILTKI